MLITRPHFASTDLGAFCFIMECPHCKKDIEVANSCFYNADTYHRAVRATTECCGHMVYIRPIRFYEITKYQGKLTEDDWGVKAKNNKNGN